MGSRAIGWAVETRPGTPTAPTEFVDPASLEICPTLSGLRDHRQVAFIGGYRPRISRQTQRAERRAMRKRAGV